MGIVRTENFTSDDGKKRVREFYDNGTIVERISDDEQPTNPEPSLTATEQAIMQTTITTEYMAALMEIQ